MGIPKNGWLMSWKIPWKLGWWLGVAYGSLWKPPCPISTSTHWALATSPSHRKPTNSWDPASALGSITIRHMRIFDPDFCWVSNGAKKHDTSNTCSEQQKQSWNLSLEPFVAKPNLWGLMHSKFLRPNAWPTKWDKMSRSSHGQSPISCRRNNAVLVGL